MHGATLCAEMSLSLYGRLCTETACVQSPLMCGLGAYVFDAFRRDPESGFTAECVAPANQIGFVL
jgi:hypothetical protein